MTHHSVLRSLREDILVIALERLAWRVEAADPDSAAFRAALVWLNACRAEMTRRYAEGIGQEQKDLRPHG